MEHQKGAGILLLALSFITTAIIALISSIWGPTSPIIQLLLVLLAGLLNWGGAFLFSRHKSRPSSGMMKLASTRSVAIHRDIDTVRRLAESEFDARKREDLGTAELFGKISVSLSAVSEGQARNIEEWHMAVGLDPFSGESVVGKDKDTDKDKGEQGE